MASVATCVPHLREVGHSGLVGYWESGVETWQSTRLTVEKNLDTQNKDERENLILFHWARITFVHVLAYAFYAFHTYGERRKESGSEASQGDNKDKHSHTVHCWTV